MYCSSKCAKKDISTAEITERKCKVSGCKNKFRSRHCNICASCQSTRKYCMACGSLIESNKNEIKK